MVQLTKRNRNIQSHTPFSRGDYSLVNIIKNKKSGRTAFELKVAKEQEKLKSTQE